MYKAGANRPLSETRRLLNKFLSRLRGHVERVFGSWKRDYGFSRSRYVGLRKM